MNGSTQKLLDLQLSVLSGSDIVLYTTAPTYTTEGVEPTDTDYVRVDMATIVDPAGEDGDTPETRQIVNSELAAVFGSAGAATGYTIVAVGILSDAEECWKWVPYNKVIAVGEIPRIPLNELTVIVS